MTAFYHFNQKMLDDALAKAYPKPIRVRAGEIDLAATIREFLSSRFSKKLVLEQKEGKTNDQSSAP